MWREWAWGADSGSASVRRRRFLAGVGAAGAAAVAGCSSDSGEGTTTNQTTDTTTSMRTQTTDDGSGDSMDDQDMSRRFGTTVPAGSDAGMSADHTVNLELRPVDGREIPEFYFEPTGLQIDVGDTVQFNIATPHHNVNAYHPAFGYTQRVPDGVPAFSSPILAGGDAWYYTFDTEGVHDYVCAPHEIYGMAGRVVVGSATGPGANPIGEAPGGPRARPPEMTAGTVLGDDAMAPDNIVSEGSVSWSDIADENKQLQIRPVEE